MPPPFDIIFSGGGTTACVIAGRLAAADPSLKILVVESGQHSREVPRHVQPCRFIENLAPDSTTIFSHAGKPSIHLNGRAPVVLSGRSVGGGSTVNFMFYAQGAASDYDDWAAFGNEGWSFSDLLPLFKKFETFNPIRDLQTHGYSGPIQISLTATNIGIGHQFLDVAKTYDPSRPQVDDANDFKTANAYSPCYRYVDPVTGKRSDAASGYLYPQLGHSNLEIMVGKHVKRVIIEDGRAVGIEYMTGHTGELVVARARKLVVISAGAFGSPSVLERSGIGSSSALERCNVPVVVDLPGVGENYQDHVGVFLAFFVSDETETMDDIWRNPEEIKACLKEWEENGTGKIAHNSSEAMVKVRPAEEQLRSTGHALQLRWETFFRDRPDKPMGMIVPFSGLPGDPTALPGRKSLSITYYLTYPDSVGSVHITSGEDPSSPLDFDPDFFSKAADVEQLTLLYKMARELVRRMPCYRGEVATYHPKFVPGSAAACRETDGPVPIDAPDIVYSDADNEAIVNFHRDKVGTTSGHSLGTCAMKPRDLNGVVDARLNVYGVKSLKVADLSICPTIVGNNTCSTALLIGEKAATIIAQDLGLAEERSEFDDS